MKLNVYTLTEVIAGAAVVGIVLLILMLPIGFKGCAASSGFRDGTLQKFSKKGVFFDTYEGELAVKGITTKGGGDFKSIGNTFEFSVFDEKIAEQIEALPPECDVRIRYRQHRWVFPTQGCTAYEATKVEQIGDAK